MDSFDKKDLHQLIISQLREDGYPFAASQISQATLTPNIDPIHPGRLAHLVALGLAIEKEKGIEYVKPTRTSSVIDVGAVLKEIRGIDFEAEVDNPVRVPYPNFNTSFIATHKKVCCTARFTPDGKYIATGSFDSTIKLLDVEKMINYNDFKKDEDKGSVKPVIKTFYAHEGRINDLDFHPSSQFLASCSEDKFIKIFDLGPEKKVFKIMEDTHEINTIRFHPSGEYILSGTDHTMVRIYDVNAEKAFVNPKEEDNHFGRITTVDYTTDGKMYATGSDDGSVKVWDGISSECIFTIPNAHSGATVNTVQFSKNKKYLLTSGMDSWIHLWDLSTRSKVKQILTGNHQGNSKPLKVTFSFNEDFILSPEENSSNACVVWDTRTGEVVQRLTGHVEHVRAVATSPTHNYCVTCSEDSRARFWVT